MQKKHAADRRGNNNHIDSLRLAGLTAGKFYPFLACVVSIEGTRSFRVAIMHFVAVVGWCHPQVGLTLFDMQHDPSAVQTILDEAKLKILQKNFDANVLGP